MKLNLNAQLKFKDFALNEDSLKWESANSRIDNIYEKDEDLATDFERDACRILSSSAYRRLNNKTQIFYSTDTENICTRMEHTNIVASISQSLATFLGLNTELVNAIAIGHDLGQLPLGSESESVIRNIIVSNGIDSTFLHEPNSLRFVDKIETLLDYDGVYKNLSLTYAVRDGILCHYDMQNNRLLPREEFFNLETIKHPGGIMPYTYEACVVSIADKIAYLGRDIEDALECEILSEKQRNELEKILQSILGKNTKISEINTASLIYQFVVDVCNCSTPEGGLCFSEQQFEIMNIIKTFNRVNIYNNKKLIPFKNYAKLIIETIFDVLDSYYDYNRLIYTLNSNKSHYPILTEYFTSWLVKYSNIDKQARLENRYQNKMIYNIKSRNHYRQAIIDFISGMTDQFAIRIFEELTTF